MSIGLYALSRGEAIIRLTSDALDLRFLSEDEDSTESGEFDIDHTGEVDGEPDAFCWTFISPELPVSVSDETLKRVNGTILPSHFFRVANNQTLSYRRHRASFLRIRPISETAKKMGVLVYAR